MRVLMRSIMMGCLALGIGMLLVASNATAQGTNRQTPSKEELQRLYIDYLTGEGYKPEVDSDGDVRFKREGKVFFINVRESVNDPGYFSVVLPNIWPIEGEEEHTQARVAADKSNAISKVSKVFTVKDDVWVSIQLFVARPEDFKGIFKRAMSALDNGVAQFNKNMRNMRE